MPTRFVCLANSFKEGGRCLAGVELDANNNALIVKGHPKWIRPICNTPHGEVPNEIAVPFQILDIIEIDNTEAMPELYQSENVLFDVRTISKIGVFDIKELLNICENKRYIFKTRYPSLSEEVIQELDYSLMLVKPEKWEVVEKTYEDRANPQQRMIFSYNGFTYDLSITDPVFLRRFQANSNFINDYKEIILSLSVGVKFLATNRFYKLVAGIILLNQEPSIVTVDNEDDLPLK
jgi:hypothetical protein